MSKSRGLKIVVEFDQDILGDVSGNLSAFSVTGFQRNPLPYGPVQSKTYTIGSIGRVAGMENAIELVFSDTNRFSDAVGNMVVSYNSEVGSLSGKQLVESFSLEFSPEGLVGTPVHQEHVVVGVHSASLTTIRIEYETGYHPDTNYVASSLYSASLSVTKV